MLLAAADPVTDERHNPYQIVAALNAIDAQDARGAEGKKHKVDNSAGSVDWEQQARTFENERDIAIETRNQAVGELDTALAWHHTASNTVNTLTTQHANIRNDRDTAIAARVAAEQAATFATQRAEASDLRATAAEHRVAVMQQELQTAQAELAASSALCWRQ